MAWRKNVPFVQPQETVSAAVVGRPDRALERRTAELKERLDAGELPQANFDYDAPLDPDLLEGQPVFWSIENKRYEAALAGMETDAATGAFVITAASECVGLLYRKSSTAAGTVVLGGCVKLPAITNAIGSPVVGGRYYLSSSAAGTLVKSRPAIAMPVCFVMADKDACGDGPWVIVSPQLKDPLEDHVHYRFSLVCRPAGTHTAPSVGNPHVITDADDSLPGWLPAGHASFNNQAPAAAAFGYNLAAHPALARVWPPLPIGAVAVLWDKGAELVGAAEVPLGQDGLVICDTNGIWWMSDCYGDVPWPTTLDTTASDSDSSSSSAHIECPREEVMRVIVAFVRMVYATNTSVVTSLSPLEGSPIVVKNCDGNDATTGDLLVGIDLDAVVGTDNTAGARVLKGIGDNFVFTAGYMVEGIIAGSSNISVTGSVQRNVDDVTVHQGYVIIDVNLDPAEREISPQVVRLDDVVERFYLDIPHLAWPEDRDSSITLRLNVPAEGVPTAPKMVIRMSIFGRAAATLPNLGLSYRRLTRPNGGPVALPTSDTSLGLVTAVAVTADEAIEVESDQFTISAGDTVFITVSRDADAGYSSEIGLIRLTGVIVPEA